MKSIAGCSYITESVQKSKVFGSHFLEFSDSKNDEVGNTVPMPNPSIKPVKIIRDSSDILLELDGIGLEWAKLTCLSAYGVYYSIIALFGDKHWVTQDRSGTTCLRVYEVPFS
jgi:hypothetical protein